MMSDGTIKSSMIIEYFIIYIFHSLILYTLIKRKTIYSSSTPS